MDRSSLVDNGLESSTSSCGPYCESRDDIYLQVISKGSQLSLVESRRDSKSGRRNSWPSSSAFDNVAFQKSEEKIWCPEPNDGKHQVAYEETNDPKSESMLADKEQAPSLGYVTTIRTPPDGDWGWLVVACAALITTTTVGLIPCYGVLLSLDEGVGHDLLASDHWRLWIWMATSTYCLQKFTSPVFRFLSQRLSARKLAAFGSVLCCLLYILCYINHSRVWIYAVFAAAGIGISACNEACVCAAEEYFSSQVHVAKSLATSGSAIGLLLWPRLLDFSFYHGGAKWTLFVIGCMCIIAVLASTQFRPSAPYYRVFYVKHDDWMCSEQECMLKNVPEEETVTQSKLYLYVFICMTAVVDVGRVFVMFLLPRYIISSGLTSDGVSNLFFYCGTAEFIGRLFGGWMVDHQFEPAFQCYLFANFLLAGTVLTMSVCNSYWAFVICLTVLGVSWGLWTSLLPWTITTFRGHRIQHSVLCSLLAIAAPFLKDVSFPWVEVKSSALCIYGLGILVAFLGSNFTRHVFIIKHNRNNVLV